MEITSSTMPFCDPETVKCHLGGEAETTSFDTGRLKLTVPHSNHLPDKLDKFEMQKKNLEVNGNSVSNITLDQVFMK